MRAHVAFAMIACAAMASAQHWAGNGAIAELRGTIHSVQIARGAGMPYLEVADGKKVLRVYLGSIRYLIEQNFNPKKGQTVAVKAFKVDDDLLAATVAIQGEKPLRLRDEAGMPLWRGGWRGRGPSMRAEDAEKKQP